MEDFLEADVLWPEDPQLRPSSSAQALVSCDSNWNGAEKAAPIDIPHGGSARIHRSWKLDFSNREGDGGNGGSDGAREERGSGGRKKMVPPHLLVARRFSGKMASSVCSGQGRTLKGRDLSQFRNSILRLTGFLEG